MYALLFALISGISQAVDDPWADAVLESVAIQPLSGFDHPQRTLEEPSGASLAAPNNGGVASLGTAGSYITLKFNTPVVDDPRNPMGLDFIVYGNAFWVGHDPQRKWTEPALVSISRDVNGNSLADDPWYYFSGSRTVPPSVLPGGMANPDPPLSGAVVNPFSTDSDPGNDGEEYDWGYAELSPTQQKYLDNYLRPDDPFTVGLTPGAGGGDAFDIAWAVDAAGTPANLLAFDFVRIWSFLSGMNAELGPITPEIDAVADVAPDLDADGDGILDEYESRVAGTDPLRLESTVLALEIPFSEGGSPAGTLLGEVFTEDGFALALFSAGTRTGARDFNALLDIRPISVALPPLAGRIRTQFRREFRSSIGDFVQAQVEPALMTLPYTLEMIAGLDPLTLSPFRWSGSAYTQDGITAITRDTANQTVSFRTRYPGVFVLLGAAPISTAPLQELWVDFAWDEDELGTFPFPFNSMQEGIDRVREGGHLEIKAGTTSEGIRIDKPMRLRAHGGAVRIGD